MIQHLNQNTVDAITDISYKAVNRYYKVLSTFGYYNQEEVNKMLVLFHIEELLNGQMQVYLSDEDIKIISKALNKLYGSNCLIDYSCNFNNDSIYGIMKRTFIPRITEDNMLRITENLNIRHY